MKCFTTWFSLLKTENDTNYNFVTLTFRESVTCLLFSLGMRSASAVATADKDSVRDAGGHEHQPSTLKKVFLFALSLVNNYKSDLLIYINI